MAECFNGYIGNRGGIPIIEAAQSSAGSATTNAIYTLPCHVFGKGCKGIIVVNFLGATAAAVAPINAQLAEIKCAQPNTVTVPYYPFTVQPNCGCGTNYNSGCGSCQNQFWY